MPANRSSGTLGGGLGQQQSAAGMPAAALPMPPGMGYANNGYPSAPAGGPAGGGGLPPPPPPPPLPPGTVIPQNRPLPPAMPTVSVMPLGGLQLPDALPAASALAAPAVARKVLERPANG